MHWFCIFVGDFQYWKNSLIEFICWKLTLLWLKKILLLFWRIITMIYFFYLNCPIVCFNIRNHKSSLYFTIFFYLQKEHELRKKNEGKNIRKEKNEVTDMLFSAFEQHQYYNVKDLIRITKQPIVSIYIFSCIFKNLFYIFHLNFYHL